MIWTYLIIVIFFTLTQFLGYKIYTEIYTVNCQFTQKIGNLHSKLPIFRVKSVKNLHRPEKFTLTASAASATIMRYGTQWLLGKMDFIGFVCIIQSVSVWIM